LITVNTSLNKFEFVDLYSVYVSHTKEINRKFIKRTDKDDTNLQGWEGNPEKCCPVLIGDMGGSWTLKAQGKKKSV